MSRTAQGLAATVLASGALLAAAALPATAADDDHGRHPRHRSAVVLGAIQYDSPGLDVRSNRSLNAEWVTVTNTGRWAVNLSGWTLSDADYSTYHFGNLRLRAHESVRVHTGAGRDTDHDVYQYSRSHIWDNDSDTATLRNDRGRTIDAVSWGRYHGDHDGNEYGHHGNGGGRHRHA